MTCGCSEEEEPHWTNVPAEEPFSTYTGWHGSLNVSTGNNDNAVNLLDLGNNPRTIIFPAESNIIEAEGTSYSGSYWLTVKMKGGVFLYHFTFDRNGTCSESAVRVR
jgi:hypothetical protein